MANIKDMIPAFELFQPTSVEAALDLLDEHGARGWVLAGGLDSFDWFKDRIKRPEAVIEAARQEGNLAQGYDQVFYRLAAIAALAAVLALAAKRP